jgi:predicted nucleic acid-binding protein
MLPSQVTPASDAFFLQEASVLIAPAIFAFEVRNALIRAERRGMIGSDAVDEASAQVSLVVELRPWSDRPVDFVRLLGLARREGLSLFDTAYLDLALREGAMLASRDGPLLEAAVRRGLGVSDLR